MWAVRIGFGWLRLLAVSLVVVAIGWWAITSTLHLSLLTVQTGSMRPAFSPGDALVMQKSTWERLKPGMIVTYHSPRNLGVLVSHRLISLNTAHGTFQTKGDALTQADPTASDSLLAGRVVAVLPSLGRIIGWLQSPAGLIVSVYVPAAVLAWGELQRLERYFKRLRPYYLYKGQVV